LFAYGGYIRLWAGANPSIFPDDDVAEKFIEEFFNEMDEMMVSLPPLISHPSYV
jgi:hypothetical protein